MNIIRVLYRAYEFPIRERHVNPEILTDSECALRLTLPRFSRAKLTYSYLRCDWSAQWHFIEYFKVNSNYST
ncbi:unnamed protein product [Schistosoma margrebowiei]|uniref:Uncharacterized protein n=1 Tax=Schistosoma margrebowiei TaxID=48269 RepID=A0AA85ALL3_9TREM|nr:unnamed protein product [Schistosoma margrebowiei]